MSNRATILVVDDDPDIIKATTRVLESQGYRVIAALNGEECLEKIQEGRPDLIILDLLMPKLDGFGVCRELRENKYAEYSDIPILIATAVREDASRRRYELETGVDLDVDGYLEKPIRPLDLLHRVEKLLQKSHIANRKSGRKERNGRTS
jgi:two-component system alkaline phosphatase synthesis response regulator PhoP